MFQIVAGILILFLFPFVICDNVAFRCLYSLTLFVVIQMLVQYCSRLSGPANLVKAVILFSFTLEVFSSDLSWNTGYPV
jgi:hypothetical protein